MRYWKQDIRVSASYLYRIKIDDIYLLIEGSRFDQMQPIGGVFKYYESGGHELKKLGVRDDSLIGIDDVSRGDLRVRVPARNLVGFFQWFDSERGRETDCWREFFEELVGPGYLPRDDFSWVDYEWVKRHIGRIRFSEYAKSMEILVAEIVELRPTEEQQQALLSLTGPPDAPFLWASQERIERRGAVSGQTVQEVQIAEHSEWIL